MTMASSLNAGHRMALRRHERLGRRRSTPIGRLVVARLLAIASMIFAGLRRRVAERKALSDLAALNDRLLRDIGLDRTDVRYGGRRIFSRRDA